MNNSGVLVNAGFLPGWSPPAFPSVGTCVEQSTTTPPQGTLASAGTLAITDGARTVNLTPNTADSYYLTDQARLYSGGEVLTIAAAGGDVPAFDATLTAPGPPQITAPSSANGMPLAVSRSSDLHVNWSTVMGDEVVVEVGGNPVMDNKGGTTLTRTVLCYFPASALSGVVPSSSLQGFMAGEGDLSAYGESRATSTTGGWQIALSTTYRAINSTGMPTICTCHFYDTPVATASPNSS